MLVRCLATRGSDLGPFHHGLFHTSETRFRELKVDGVAYFLDQLVGQ